MAIFQILFNNKQTRLPLAALLAVSIWMAGALLKPQRVESQSAPPAADFSAQFRIAVGVKDTQPKDWQGQIKVSGGEIAGVSGWRFSQQDQASNDGSFEFRTKVGPLENQLLTEHPYGQTDWGDPHGRRLIPEGLIVRLRGSSAARVTFNCPAGTFSFSTAGVVYGMPLSLLEGNATVERLPVEQKLSEEGVLDDYPAMTLAPNGERWVAWLSYRDKADEIVVSGAGQLHHVSGRGDHNAPAISSDGQGRIHVVYSGREGDTYQLFETVWSNGNWSKPQQLTTNAGSDLWPQLVSDGKDRLALVWQGFRNNESVILAKLWDGQRWAAEQRISEGGGNAWMPSAAFGGGKLWIAWDSYATGAYQIYVRELGGAAERVTHGENFSVRASIATLPSGKPVVAWEESGPLWGKDFSWIIERRGTVIYKDRKIRVAYREGSDWKEIPAPVADAAPANIRRYLQQPELATDEGGHLYMTFRSRTSASVARIDYWAAGGRWNTFLTSLDGNYWTPAILMPESVGRNSMRAAVTLHGNKVNVVWATDARRWPGGKYGDLDVFATVLDATARPASIEGGRTIVAPPVEAKTMHPNEREDIRRIRAYRYRVNGKTYRIVRGDLHRHTELSGDGAGDGMLQDLYRYELDAIAFDFGYVSDHQMGQDEEYNWWITQKSNDLYYMPQRFVPMYGYERSVWWPNGHRNVVWDHRGEPVLKIGAAEREGKANTGPILYPYLAQTHGIAMPHTSATEQGTDWRDNNQDLEPLVEIYQGYESSYETADAPRAWHPGESKQHQGPRPAGYVWNAWAKGYKLGVQASSDHVSTHVSYSCILVEDYTRQGILDAIRKRHAYAATDTIIMDFRIQGVEGGTALMGDIVNSSHKPKLIAKIIGTAPIKHVDVIKNNTYVHKLDPNRQDVTFEYVDEAAQPGESYYYVRAVQTDGQVVWSSPIWVRYQTK